VYREFKILISSCQLKRCYKNLKFNVHRSSSLACIGALSSTVNYLLKLFSQSHLDPYSICLNLQFLFVSDFFCLFHVHLYGQNKVCTRR